MSSFVGGFLRGIGLPEDAAVRLSGPRPPLPARLPAGDLAWGAVGAFALAAEVARDAVRGAATGGPPVRAPDRAEPVRLDPIRIAASFRSDQLGRLGGQPPAVWAPLSGFFRAADGWVRTHANYPWHAAALRAVLGLGQNADGDAVAAAIAERGARELEAAAFRAGGLAVAVRDPATWAAERGAPQAPIRVRRGGNGRAAPTGDPLRPLAGIRVLDLTRVIAGPVATRALAGLGADVLRVDSPVRPEPLWQWLDTGRGKRSSLLDLEDRADRSRFAELLAEADVVVTGARPGALARFGLEPEQIAESHPDIVTARVRAWAPSGDWGERRGFDSLVQAACGIAAVESADREAPGKLPAQALDHSGGALLAAGVTALLAERNAGAVEVTLESIGRALLAVEPAASSSAGSIDPELLATVDGFVPEAAPSRWGALGIVGEAYLPSWQSDPGPWAGRAFGEDPPRWR